jgi:hypothetical protein
MALYMPVGCFTFSQLRKRETTVSLELRRHGREQVRSQIQRLERQGCCGGTLRSCSC